MPAYVDATAPAVEEQLRQLRALPRPDDDRIEAYVAKVEQALRLARDLAAAAERGHEAEARAVGRRTQAVTQELRALARELGAERCSSQ
ncbi:MAG: hypothetical protein ICV67_08500 [Thermoleophilia bacterium]|nr:hypothetical protein [Thermoleophilia bacterium]